MRWLLEPAALGQAMDGLGRRYVGERRGHAAKAQRRRLKPATLERLEIELHVEIVLRCANEQLRNAIQRNQLPLIATHSTFAGQRYPDEIKIMLSEHLAIFDHILAGQKKAAMVALEAHIRRSLEPSIERLTKLGSLPEKLQKPFLIQVI